MSRSNPTDNTPNPAVRWFEWNGEKGTVRYYDKTLKTNVDLGVDFTFLLLDELGGVRGWHEASSSGIYSNEVRDTRQDVIVVKAFKGGTLAEGLYKAIKDRVNTMGGSFVANCYIAFKNTDGMDIGCFRFKGAALGAWMEFRKANKPEIYKQAITITGHTEGKKGRVIFRTPKFELKALSAGTNEIAVGLDAELQAYLKGYLARNTKDQAHANAHAEPPQDDYEPPSIAPADDDIPFAWFIPILLPLAALGAAALSTFV